MKIFKLLCFSLLLFSGFGSIAAQGAWTKLGSAKVTGHEDHDQIWVTGIQGSFTAIKLFVRNEGIEFDHVIVHYGNGTHEELEMRNFIKAGGETRVMDLKGGDRIINHVDFYYKSNANTKPKGQVILYGRR